VWAEQLQGSNLSIFSHSWWLTATPSRPLHGKWFVKDNQGALIPAPPEAHDSEQARQVFVEELHNVQDAAWNALGKEAVVNALCIPNFFNDSSVRSVWDAVEEAGLRIHQPWQIIRWLNAARLAYSLNSCHAFGLDQKDCDIDEGPHQVVYVDYQPDTLELNVADVTEHGALPEYRARVLLVDDDERILSQIGNALTKLTQSSTFVRSQHRFGRFYFLRAIIVSGEVSQPSMEELHNVLVEAFPGQESKIRDSIDPLYIGAVGAAFKARYFTLHPEALRDYDYCQLGVELDEL